MTNLDNFIMSKIFDKTHILYIGNQPFKVYLAPIDQISFIPFTNRINSYELSEINKCKRLKFSHLEIQWLKLILFYDVISYEP